MLKTNEIIDFKPFTPEDKSLYEKYLFSEEERGCEFALSKVWEHGGEGGIALAEKVLKTLK